MVKPCGLFGPFLFFFLLIRARAETESTTQAVALWECGYGQPGEVAGPAGLALCTFGTNQVTPRVTRRGCLSSLASLSPTRLSLHGISYSRSLMTCDS